MKQKSIKLQRVESILKELIPEALSSLDDSRVSGLNITDVDCSKGKYDADVYFYTPFLDDNQKKEVLKTLKSASSKLESYTLASTSWYRSPKFHFKYDKKVEELEKMEKLFQRIKSE